MPWSTPPLKEVRELVRDSIHGQLPGSDAAIPNSVLRVLGDAQGALCFLTLEYIDWLALQLLPDTAETEWLDRHGDIWLVNADGTIGRKKATLATGTIICTGVYGAAVPAGAMLGTGASVSATYQVTAQTFIGTGPTQVPATSLIAGTIANLNPDDTLGFLVPPIGVDGQATVLQMDGGADIETDDELRTRILFRIQQPPMGGDTDDYILWALSYPGVTRAWSYPLEMGIGTVTVRFMMDDLRADNNGFPNPDDVANVAAYLDTVRPVAVKDFFVEAPIPYPIDISISNLNSDDASTRANITQSLKNSFFQKSQPGQTWYRAWTDEAIINAVGVVSYDLGDASDIVMPATGYMPVVGDIKYVSPPL
jgi:uncharacterized phage protein gp47/JayE